MPWLRFGLRWLCLLAWSVWVGGFMFYGGVVVPILHEAVGNLEGGAITREVTLGLNGLGALTLLLWWLDLALEARRAPVWLFGLRVGTLGLMTGLWALLVVLHAVMAARLDAGAMTRFYPLHRLYLGTSTLQWLASLVQLACGLFFWTRNPSWARPDRSHALEEQPTLVLDPAWTLEKP